MFLRAVRELGLLLKNGDQETAKSVYDHMNLHYLFIKMFEYKRLAGEVGRNEHYEYAILALKTIHEYPRHQILKENVADIQQFLEQYLLECLHPETELE